MNGSSADVDLLYRVTNDFAVNATINPDFGQVEAGPAVVNLPVYETFLEEKRPFFIEGSEIFAFGRNTSGGRLFYTRRIGRSPQLRPPSQAADVPEVITILGAAKVSGKTSSGWSLGMIEAVTGRGNARYRTSSSAEERFAVEPLTNYLVARARKDANQGRTSIGGIVTAVNRNLATDPLRRSLRSSAYAGGVDMRTESANRAWVLLGSAAFSRVAGTPDSRFHALCRLATGAVGLRGRDRRLRLRPGSAGALPRQARQRVCDQSQFLDLTLTERRHPEQGG